MIVIYHCKKIIYQLNFFKTYLFFELYIYVYIYIYSILPISSFSEIPPSISKVGAVKIPAAEEDPDAEEATDDPAD